MDCFKNMEDYMERFVVSSIIAASETYNLSIAFFSIIKSKDAKIRKEVDAIGEEKIYDSIIQYMEDRITNTDELLEITTNEVCDILGLTAESVRKRIHDVNNKNFIAINEDEVNNGSVKGYILMTKGIIEHCKSLPAKKSLEPKENLIRFCMTEREDSMLDIMANYITDCGCDPDSGVDNPGSNPLTKALASRLFSMIAGLCYAKNVEYAEAVKDGQDETYNAFSLKNLPNGEVPGLGGRNTFAAKYALYDGQREKYSKLAAMNKFYSDVARTLVDHDKDNWINERYELKLSVRQAKLESCDSHISRLEKEMEIATIKGDADGIDKVAAELEQYSNTRIKMLKEIAKLKKPVNTYEKYKITKDGDEGSPVELED